MPLSAKVSRSLKIAYRQVETVHKGSRGDLTWIKKTGLPGHRVFSVIMKVSEIAYSLKTWVHDIRIMNNI